jgi:hypothetical protein
LVERPVQRPLIAEIAVAAIDRERGGGDRCQNRARATVLDMVALARRDNYDFMAELSRGAEFRFHIGPHAAAVGRVKSANIDDPHRRRSGELAVNFK